MSSERGPRLTIVSRSFPPLVSGSAILMGNLLASYAGNVSAIAGYNQYAKLDPAFLPPCPTRYLTLPRLLPRVYDGTRRRWPRLLCRSLQGSIRRALIKLRANVVLATLPYEDFFVAAFLAARQLHLPFFAYMHDLWMENMPAGTPMGRFSAKWEPKILQESTRVLCITEAMQAHYEKKYGISTDLLPHSIAEQDLLRAPAVMRRPQLPKTTVLFVGTVSDAMNLDALKVLASASELLPQGYELLYCTSVDLAMLKRMGIHSSRLRAQYASRAEVQRLQSAAHVLIAPLSHKHASNDEVRTVFSTKLLEYLISGRPIIVFAPDTSYQTESARKNGWGYIVTEDSPAALATAILKVTTDEHVAAEIVCAALQEARSRSAKHHADRLQEWVLKDCR